ncbi:glycosyltransferase involved in cell wall biosynthesis [Flavobacterium arsenatis]|uniref:Glycosyltransferase involved in cell wall biosynthesis n=1 Tax=Flavobacterium arsenatis TaxID=1484332 RepID=A0ABU1TRA1_9FLAO|nr:glycosyltransferase family 4 protein [Flavobacterium arsenatis]MDR6968288.1 glycosyltransferase involved in cell wall biosynthesis [Flavobacterium arsenatis]
MPNKKVCLIIPSLRHGGAERVISVLANQWAQNPNLEVFLLLMTKQDQFYTIDDRVKIIEPEKGYQSTLLGRGLYSLWILYFLRKSVNQIKPNTILSFCERYNNIVLLSLLGSRYPVFVSDRSNPEGNLGSLHENLRKTLYKKAKGIIAQTDTAKKVIYSKTKNKNIETIPNPLRDIKDFSIVQKENIILNVGRFEWQKNQKGLVEAFSNLQNRENWKLLLVGVGSLRGELEQQIRQKNLEDQVILLDFQKDIDSYFQTAKIFAFTSISEGFPNVLLEAMANGLACVSYDCPTGPSELIQNEENGNLIPLHDQELFSAKLQLLMDDNDKRIKFGTKAVVVKEEYSVAVISDKYLKFILK